MRVSIPDKINRGKQILAQRDRILAQASEEQARTIEIANEKKEQLISASEITIDAKKRADQIVSQAMTEAEIRAAIRSLMIRISFFPSGSGLNISTFFIRIEDIIFPF